MNGDHAHARLITSAIGEALASALKWPLAHIVAPPGDFVAATLAVTQVFAKAVGVDLFLWRAMVRGTRGEA